MSIDDQGTVDFLVIERGHPKIVLVISDHWDWSQPLEHVYALQEKMNTYVGFIESGEVWESASKQSGQTVAPGSIPIEVKVFLRSDPPPMFLEFMGRAREVFATLSASLTHELRPDY